MLAQNICYLARRGGFTRALQAHKHDDSRLTPLKVKRGGFTAKQADQLIMNDLDHLLCRTYPFEHFLAETLLAHVFNKVFNDLEVNVRFQQGQPHFAQAGLHVFFGKLAASAERTEYAGKSV